ncbi:NAD-dependent epimerase/dehydratase family protein [Marinobacter sp. C2H3]|uniref:NAD-dependent epimerase/dehydratase family protein n=1 Tax=Marinobacter sp. C2H3 TaxID=3119003 RepID=UPI00300EEEBC
MSQRVLVTGSEGFTGRYLVEELEGAGYEVVGLGSHESSAKGYIQADLTEVEALKAAIADVQPDVVIHLAALAFVGHGDPNAFYRVNLMGTRNLLEALGASGKTPESVLLASSANVYGNQKEGELTEHTPPAPANDYAVSKLAMEHMARTWLPALPITLVRPFNYTGVGQADSFLLPKIVSHFKRKASVIELGNLDVWRDFSDVRAVVQAYRKLIERKPVGETFNVASGRTHSLREVLALCTELSGHELEVRVNPAFVRANEVKTLCGNADKLRACIGDWKTPELKDTLRWMLDGTA